MIAATSRVVSSWILFRRKSTQCHSHDGNVLSKAQRAHEAYGDGYAPGIKGLCACCKLGPVDGELAEQRHAWRAGGQVQRLRVEQRLGSGTGEGDLGAAQRIRHECFRCVKRWVM